MTGSGISLGVWATDSGIPCVVEIGPKAVAVLFLTVEGVKLSRQVVLAKSVGVWIGGLYDVGGSIHQTLGEGWLSTE